MRVRSAIGAVLLAGAALPSLYAAPASAAEVDVTIVDFLYDPDPVLVEPGDTITWTNLDPGPHTVSANDGSFTSYLNEGESFTLTVDENGEIGYYCKLHGAPGEGMAGTIQVGAEAPPESEDLTAADNAGTSVAWSQSTFPDGAAFAVVGRDDLFADSLSSGAVQGELDAPLLLTDSEALDPDVAAELDRLGVRRVAIFGGPAAVSPAVEQAIQALDISTVRISGATRVDTALAAARAYFPGARSALLVRSTGSGSQAFADTLAAGAFAAGTGQPVLLTPTDALPDSVRQYIVDQGLEAVTIIGGEAAVSAAVADAVEATGATVERVAGANRFDTAVQLAFSGDEPSHVTVIDGVDEDAWADGFAAAARKAPVVLADGDELPSSTAYALVGGGPPIICGTSLSATACDRSRAAQGVDYEFPVVAAVFDGAGGALGVYAGESPTTLCFDTFPPVPLEPVLQTAGGEELLVIELGASPFGDPFGCLFDLDEGLVANLLANPGDHQITSGGVTEPVFAVEFVALAEALGEAEVPGPGDPDGFVLAFVFRGSTPSELCVLLAAFAPPTSPVTAAHIHEGASGENGPVVVELTAPVEGGSAGCYDIGEALVEGIAANPDGFYLNVHTEAHPDGAVRGQLFNPFAG